MSQHPRRFLFMVGIEIVAADSVSVDAARAKLRTAVEDAFPGGAEPARLKSLDVISEIVQSTDEPPIAKVLGRLVPGVGGDAKITPLRAPDGER